MPLFDRSSMLLNPKREQERKADPDELYKGEKGYVRRSNESSEEGTAPGAEKEVETEEVEDVTGPSVKLPVILKPEHMEWVEEQDFGLSEWVRNAISEEMEEKNAGSRKKEETAEETDSTSEMCDVCGENPATEEEINENGEVTKLCKECFRKRVGEPSREQERKTNQNSEPSDHLCERCKKEFGMENKAVRKSSMGGNRERWLCETCLQEIGEGQVRRH